MSILQKIIQHVSADISSTALSLMETDTKQNI